MRKFKYLFFDLDGTLLHFDMQRFIDRYLKLIIPHFTDTREPRRIPEFILHGTNLMLKNDGQRLNADVFLEYFSRQVELPVDEVWQRFLHFYQTDFGSLAEITRAEKQVKILLEAAVAGEYRLVLATQPVFPLVAIQQRLKWAGLAAVPFTLITHIENMHACKPSLFYFREILEYLQARAGQCLMIGNEVETDMASRHAGIRTFFLTDKACVVPEPQVDYSGDYPELSALLGLV
jgi:FMN phosphatase YigB (HAD superfamily)